MAETSSFIKLDRNILESPLFDDAETLKLWIYLLANTAYDERTVSVGNQIITLEKGQLIVGRKKLAEILRTTESKVYRTLLKLKSNNSIDIKPNNKFSLITIVNWAKYQDKQTKSEQQNEHPIEQQMNNKRTTNEQQTNTNKEIKKYRNKEIYNTHTYAHARGKYENVFLTDDEVAELIDALGEQRFNDSVEELSAYIYDKPDFKSEHHVVPLTTWIQDRLNERANKKARVQARDTEKKSKADKAKAAGFDIEFEDIYERV